MGRRRPTCRRPDLYADDTGQLWNRDYSGAWLWVRFDKLSYACWVALLGHRGAGRCLQRDHLHPLPKSVLYEAPDDVEAVRDGKQVTVTWDPVNMTEDDDRGYLIEARVCQDGNLIPVVVHTDEEPLRLRQGRLRKGFRAASCTRWRRPATPIR